MLDFSFSLVPFLGIAVLNFVLSWVYYSPLAPWFRTWQVSVGMDPNKKEMTEEEKKAMPRLMGGALVASLLISYGLQVLVRSLDITTFSDGMMLGFVAWFAFAVTHSLNTQFEGRKPIVLVINNGLYLITYCLFGGLMAIWL